MPETIDPKHEAVQALGHALTRWLEDDALETLRTHRSGYQVYCVTRDGELVRAVVKLEESHVPLHVP
jgi:hypothetical protein